MQNETSAIGITCMNGGPLFWCMVVFSYSVLLYLQNHLIHVQDIDRLWSRCCFFKKDINKCLSSSFSGSSKVVTSLSALLQYKSNNPIVFGKDELPIENWTKRSRQGREGYPMSCSDKKLFWNIFHLARNSEQIQNSSYIKLVQNIKVFSVFTLYLL